MSRAPSNTGASPWGVVDKPPESKGGRRRVQAAFNGWTAETARPLCRLSMILALSAD